MFSENSEKLDSALDTNIQEISDLQDSMVQLDNKMSNEISSAIRKLTKNETERIIEDMKKMMQKHASHDEISNLRRMMEMKANKYDLDEWYEIKSNKVDTDNHLSAIEILHKQVKHLVFMIMENLRVQMEAEHSNKNTRINRLNNVLQQSFWLTKWIMKFNPETINSSDSNLPEKLREFEDFVTESMEEIPYWNVKSYDNKQAISRKLNRMKTLERTPKPPLLHLGSSTAKSRIIAQFKNKNQLFDSSCKNYTVNNSAK